MTSETRKTRKIEVGDKVRHIRSASEIPTTGVVIGLGPAPYIRVRHNELTVGGAPFEGYTPEAEWEVV